MFCGIVDHTAILQRITPMDDGGVQWRVQSQFTDWVAGESIAVDGTCLTVIEFGDGWFECALSSETLAMTSAASYLEGRPVNLERAMRASDRIGGHWVSGHVDGTVSVIGLARGEAFWQLDLAPEDPGVLRWVVPKGSVALAGVSLTVNAVTDRCFSVMVIPHTLQVTNLKYLEMNHKINVEYDMLAKMVAKQVELMVTND